jgi:hypothetical protein
MKLFAYSFAALLLFVASCKTMSNVTGTKLSKVTITDPGELFSTYELEDDAAGVAALNALPGLSAEEKADIYKYSTEANWPTGMATLESRQKNRELIKKYNAYMLTSFTNSSNRKISILEVPKSKNSSISGEMALDHDIYIIITDMGIKK